MDIRLDPHEVDGRQWWIPCTVVEGKHPVRRRRKGSLIVDRTMKYVRDTGTVIQAGCHLGLWPLKLSRFFDQVLTFEVDAENLASSRKNLEDIGNVAIQYGALGDHDGTVAIQRHARSTGSHHVKVRSTSGGCPMLRIDDLDESPGALFLDIEGMELAALRGASHVLKECRPVVVVEMNNCMYRYGVTPDKIRKFIRGFGYQVVHNYKTDVVFSYKRSLAKRR